MVPEPGGGSRGSAVMRCVPILKCLCPGLDTVTALQAGQLGLLVGQWCSASPPLLLHCSLLE